MKSTLVPCKLAVFLKFNNLANFCFRKPCLESKTSSHPPLLTAATKDPYEFGTGSPSVTGKNATKFAKVSKGLSAGSGSSKTMAFPSHAGVGGRVIKPKDNSSPGFNKSDSSVGHFDSSLHSSDIFTTGQPTITTASGLINQSSAARSIGGNVMPPAKRKNTNSSPVHSSLGHTPTTASKISGIAVNSATNAISIAIPTGNLNLNLSSATLNSLNATIAGNKVTNITAKKNSMLKDVSLVVTGGTPSVVNGQIVSSLAPTPISDVTQIQLNTLNSPLPEQRTAPGKVRNRNRTGSKSGSNRRTSGHSEASSGHAGAPGQVQMAALPSGAVVMDTQPGAILATGSVAMVSGNTFGLVNAGVTSQSPTVVPTFATVRFAFFSSMNGHQYCFNVYRCSFSPNFAQV